MRSSGRNRLLYILFGRLLQFALSLAVLRVATTLLLPEEVGRMALLLATIAFFVMLLINPVGMFINRRINAWQARGLAQYYLNIYWCYLLLLSGMAALILIGLVKLRVIDFHMALGWMIVLSSGSIFFSTVNQTVIPTLNLIGKPGWFMLLTNATVASSLIVSVLLVTTFSRTAEYWMLGTLCGQLVIAVAGVAVLFRFLRPYEARAHLPTISNAHFVSMYSYVWPIAVATGLGWWQTQGYRYVLEHQLGLSALGLFFVGYGLSSSLIAAFEAVITAYFQPKFYQRISTKDEVQQEVAWHDYASATLPSLLLTMMFIAAVAPQLTSLFLGSSFQSAAVYVVWGAFAEGARVISSTYSLLAHARMRTQWLIMPSAAGAFLALTVTALLMPVLGLFGVGVGLTMAGGGFVLTMHYLVRKQVKIELPLKKMTVALGVGLLLCGTLYLFQQWLTWGTSLLVSIAIVSAAGSVFLFLQWLMLREHIRDEMVQEVLSGSQELSPIDTARVDGV